MRIGVPKEIKLDEYRVGLTPASVREYVSRGHRVMVERGAGLGIGASDDIYRSAGAAIVDTPGEIFATADMVVKVKEPQATEWRQLREGQILFTFLHLAPDLDQAKGSLALPRPHGTPRPTSARSLCMPKTSASRWGLRGRRASTR